jgi:hypothetical protein
MFEEHELADRPHLIDAHTFLVYEKQIRNLQLQEARLARRREKETAELRALQQERIGRSVAVEQARKQKASADGFEFSNAPITLSRQIENLPMAGNRSSNPQPPVALAS